MTFLAFNLSKSNDITTFIEAIMVKIIYKFSPLNL